MKFRRKRWSEGDDTKKNLTSCMLGNVRKEKQEKPRKSVKGKNTRKSKQDKNKRQKRLKETEMGEYANDVTLA